MATQQKSDDIISTVACGCPWAASYQDGRFWVTWITHFVLIVPAHAKVWNVRSQEMLAALQMIKLVRLLSYQTRQSPLVSLDTAFFYKQLCMYILWEQRLRSLHLYILTGGAFVRAKHSLSSAISVSQHASLSKRNHHAPSHSKCQRQNKVHLTGPLSHKDAGLQKVFRSHKS